MWTDDTIEFTDDISHCTICKCNDDDNNCKICINSSSLFTYGMMVDDGLVVALLLMVMSMMVMIVMVMIGLSRKAPPRDARDLESPSQFPSVQVSSG